MSCRLAHGSSKSNHKSLIKELDHSVNVMAPRVPEVDPEFRTGRQVRVPLPGTSRQCRRDPGRRQTSSGLIRPPSSRPYQRAEVENQYANRKSTERNDAAFGRHRHCVRGRRHSCRCRHRRPFRLFVVPEAWSAEQRASPPKRKSMTSATNWRNYMPRRRRDADMPPSRPALNLSPADCRTPTRQSAWALLFLSPAPPGLHKPPEQSPIPPDARSMPSPIKSTPQFRRH